jgi:hypothetical protein
MLRLQTKSHCCPQLLNKQGNMLVALAFLTKLKNQDSCTHAPLFLNAKWLEIELFKPI